MSVREDGLARISHTLTLISIACQAAAADSTIDPESVFYAIADHVERIQEDLGPLYDES